MMFRSAVFSLAVLFSAFGVQQASQAAELGPDYLHGTWVLDDGTCGDAASEHVIFRDNGAVEGTTDGKLTAAGFWEIRGDIIKAHLIASPAFFVDEREDFAALAKMEGQFHSFGIRIVPFNMEADSFGVVGLLGEEASTGLFTRCK